MPMPEARLPSQATGLTSDSTMPTPQRSATSLEPSACPEPGRPALLLDLEHRQEEVLRQLDDLNQRIEHVVNQGRLPLHESSLKG